MKKLMVILTALFVMNVCPGILYAQYTFFNPKDAFAFEVSLDNTDLKRLPMYRNSISSLAVVGDHIVGGTSAKEGLNPFVFVASLKEQHLKIGYRYITTVTINNSYEKIPFLSFFLIKTSMK